ncbi:MAG: hypothetical protein ABSF44_13030 [Candidatus Bathyarchaeia archaeon]|jgi:hypothetical protein
MKTLILPDKIDDDLAKAAEELTFMAKKPISKSMALNLLIEVYHAHLNNRCALDAFSQQLQNLDVMSPEEFDKYWDEPARPKTPRTKNKPKSKAPSTKPK